MTDQPRLPMTDTVHARLRRVEHVYAVTGVEPMQAPGVGVPDRLRTFTPTIAHVTKDTAGDMVVTVLGPNPRAETVFVTFSTHGSASQPLDKAPSWAQQLVTRTRAALLDVR